MSSEALETSGLNTKEMYCAQGGDTGADTEREKQSVT